LSKWPGLKKINGIQKFMIFFISLYSFNKALKNFGTVLAVIRILLTNKLIKK